MKRYLWFVLFLLAFALNLNAQNDSIFRVTKHSVIDSRKGSIIKFVDKKLKTIQYNPKSMYGISCKIRTFFDEGENAYFVILAEGRAMIAYSDLVEVNKAFEKLFKEVDSDCALNPDYLENKYVTDDGFKIGYYIEKSKAHWFANFNTFSRSTQTFFELKAPYEFANGLKEAQREIEIMKNK